ncbi:diguanylate cyclase [bacterium]|nr:diguanylate cyclase [bacterium]MBU1989918.1 diguanylate cyclase [bacterium]
MKYDFSKVLEEDTTIILNELMDKYVTCFNSYDADKLAKIGSYYSKITQLFNKEFESDDILKIYKKLASYKMAQDVPYIIMSSEAYGLKNILLSKMVNCNDNSNILELILLFKEINNTIAFIYLTRYIEKLVSINNVRLSSLSDILERNIIKHYEAHLTWLSDLALHIKNFQKNKFPELDDTLCEFGKWLNSDGKIIIQNDSKHGSLSLLHKNLHFFAYKIFLQLEDQEYHVLISYLEKCELISLSIGTELALIDNIQINKRLSKDALTGALTRNGLKPIFETQYELSCATNNSFIIAMCDLDYFKKINDTYGHVAGDKMLRLFVDTAKEHIRNSDIIIRYGGEEFIIILTAIKKAQGFRVLEKIRRGFEAKVLTHNEKTIQATLSIGAMSVTPDKHYRDKYFDEYIMIVDKLLYAAKINGRNKTEML